MLKNCLTLLLAGWVWSNAAPPLQIAVLPFSGDKSVSVEQLSFISGKCASELARYPQFKLLDRSRMDFILQEQGFQQSGACDASECRVQMGQMLGVDHIVAGSLVRFDRKFAIRADMISVSDGLVVHSVEQSQIGDLSDAYEPLCQKMAFELAAYYTEPGDSIALHVLPSGAEPGLSLRRKLAIALWAGALGSSGMGVYYQTQVSSAHDDYDKAWDQKNLDRATSSYNNYQDAQTSRNITLGLAGGLALLGGILWFWP